MSPRPLLVAVIGAALLVTGCSAEAAPTPTPKTSDAAPSATPTPAPAPPAKVPFDGDCTGVLSAGFLAEVFDGATTTAGGDDSIVGVMPDMPASLARLGGLTCVWSGEGAEFPTLVMTLIPETHVPADVSAAHAEFGCYGWSICGGARAQSGMWVLAEAYLPQEAYEEPAAEELEAISARLDAAIDTVFAQPAAEYSGVGAESATGSWALPPCERLAQAVTTAAGMTGPEVGFPGDNIPDGAGWRTLESSDVARWCSWFQSLGSDALIAEIHLQSGIGVPTAEQLAAAQAEAFPLAGADAAYRVAQDGGGGARSTKTLVVVGPNRLLVSGDQQDAVAAAVVATLAG